MISILVAVISSLVCPLLCAFTIWYCRRYLGNREQCQAENSALYEGVLALLRDRILYSCRYFEKQGYSTLSARVNITGLHEAYRKLGGNSVEVHEYEKFMQLPHKREDDPDVPS